MIDFLKHFLQDSLKNSKSGEEKNGEESYIYTECFRKNSKYFRRWQYGLSRVNKFI